MSGLERLKGVIDSQVNGYYGDARQLILTAPSQTYDDLIFPYVKFSERLADFLLDNGIVY